MANENHAPATGSGETSSHNGSSGAPGSHTTSGGNVEKQHVESTSTKSSGQSTSRTPSEVPVAPIDSDDISVGNKGTSKGEGTKSTVPKHNVDINENVGMEQAKTTPEHEQHVNKVQDTKVEASATINENQAESSSPKVGLLPNEGDTGTYKELRDAGEIGDNITPHHMPSAEYMKQQGVSKNDGICMNMEMPSPGTGGRHRLTSTYGRNMTDAEKQNYYSMNPREALAHDINDARKIYMEQGLYDEIRPKLMEHIKLCLETYPDIFGK